jgi:hypothetical protein
MQILNTTEMDFVCGGATVPFDFRQECVAFGEFFLLQGCHDSNGDIWLSGGVGAGVGAFGPLSFGVMWSAEPTGLFTSDFNVALTFTEVTISDPAIGVTTDMIGTSLMGNVNITGVAGAVGDFFSGIFHSLFDDIVAGLADYMSPDFGSSYPQGSFPH